MKKIIITLLVVISVSLAWATDYAPYFLSYQGSVSDSSGVPIGNANPENREVHFAIYKVTTGGTPIYGEKQTVTISGGEFSVLIGNGSKITDIVGPTDVSLMDILSNMDNTDLYLGVSVATADGTITEISPRQQLVSSAFAFRAKVAETVASEGVTNSMLAAGSVTTDKIGVGAVTTTTLGDGAITADKISGSTILGSNIGNATISASNLDQTSIGLWSPVDSNIFRSAGFVGIGTESPTSPMHVVGNDDAGFFGLMVENTNGNSTAAHSVITSKVVSGGGDPMVSMLSTDGLGWSMGMDASDSNKFKISNKWNNLAEDTFLTLDSVGNLKLHSSAWLYMEALNNNSSGIHLTMGTNDYAKIYVGGSQDQGALYIQTGDNNDEPIYFYQGSIQRAAIKNYGMELPVGGRYRCFAANNASYADMIMDPGYLSLRVYNANDGLNTTKYCNWDGDKSWNFSSDARLKKDIVDAESMLDRLLQVRFRRFHWKESNDSDPMELGVIAQELELLFPEMVKEYKHEGIEGTVKSVSYGDFSTIACKSIQELNAKFEVQSKELNRKIAHMEDEISKRDQQISALQERMSKLEARLSTGE